MPLSSPELALFIFIVFYIAVHLCEAIETLTFKNAPIKNPCISPEMVFRVLVGSYHESGI